MTRRRLPGEGQVRERADGRWEARWVDSNGRRRSLYAKTQTDAAKALRKVLTARDDGDELPSGRAPTVEEWMRYWLDRVCPRRIKRSTLANYRSSIESRVIPALGRRRLDRLTPEHLEAFYDDLAADGLSPATVLKYHRMISRALRVAEQRQKIRRNPATLIDPPRHDGAVTVRVDDTAPAAAILTEATKRRTGTRWSVALATGLRQGEALGLCWDYVDLDRGIIEVQWELLRLPWRHGCADPVSCRTDLRPMARASHCPKRKDGGLVLDRPKSAKSRRRIVVPAPLVDLLRAQRQTQLEERLAAGTHWQAWAPGDEHGGLVFTQTDGKPLDPRRDWDDWKSILGAAKVPDMRVHDARHLAATILLELGVEVKVVSEMLGHATTYFTQQVYQHVTERLAQDAADAMSERLWGDSLTPTLTPSARRTQTARGGRRRSPRA